MTRAPIWVRTLARVLPRVPAMRYRLIARLARLHDGPFVMHVNGPGGGFVFECDLADAIAREVCFTGAYEPQETLLVRQLLRPGMCFVDVGANWGYFTLLGARLVGPEGLVLALEPDPRLVHVLRANVVRNAMEQVEVLPLAAADEVAIRILHGYPEAGGNRGLSRLAGPPGAPGQRDSYRVQAMPLDRLFDDRSLPRVDLLKVDIEGAEGLALAGLDRALADRRVRRLLLELHPDQLAGWGTDPAALMELLIGHGYSGWSIDHSRGATRAAAYGRVRRPADLLHPISARGALGRWPHQLWAPAGMPPL